MTVGWIISFIAVAVLIAAVLGWRSAYRAGVSHGRMLQSTDDLREAQQAIIAKARAEQLAETWQKRARAILFASRGAGRKP